MTFLPFKDREYLKNQAFSYEELENGGQKGVVFKDYPLPPSKFQVDKAEILVILPPGYPDVTPDMFHSLPWLQLLGISRHPDKADTAVDFAGRSWQRWSRHNNEWRPGVDGIWTMLKRVDAALECAK